ncbi:MAG: MFS transporter [Kiritimatiellae bacterium]|nr:MFS transporter [Kiritimatiellia bacterium]
MPASVRRWGVLTAAVAMQLCLGATYSWAVFVAPLRRAGALSQAAAQLPFTVFYYVFPLTMTVLASVGSRPAPHRSAMLGGVLFGAAWVLAGSGPVSAGWLAATIGVAGGTGVGLAYLVPVSTAMAWFPRHRALVTGVTVAGFGGGAALLGRLADLVMSALAWSPQQTLRVFGFVFLAIVPVAACAMRTPADGADSPPGERAELREVLSSSAFRLLALTFTAGLSAGLAVNGNLRQLGGSAANEVSLVPLFALGNAAGRIGWGALADRTAPGPLLAANLAAWSLLLLCGVLWTASAGSLRLFAALAGLLYGGVLVTHPAAVTFRWGRREFMRIYGWLAAAHVIAAWAPSAAGWVYDRTGTFQLFFAGLAVLTALTSLVAWYGRHALAAPRD